ncbi:NAD(P)H-dependent oxidoreductase [Methylobacterium durans]|uniref:NAD(P)H-dependent oxidoreductase n=1 Tax=Methylobacterium durans TaxID=2202825 RepID=UPI002AFE9B01|nr:NAD(P)H-dependent oxidoreductase [Methylobacterium durans]MEA1830932.1 NAD(P)H-dependent oxidoreductase [Methylobacterium durans]
MKVLLIYCHPRPDSFSAALRDAAIEALTNAGHAVTLRDLYAEGFDPALSKDERGRYYAEDSGRGAVADHIATLQGTDALVLVYPTWWFGLPAMLKGWIDRVWLPGIAFHLAGPGDLQPRLTNIRRLVVVTTYGSPRWLLWLIGWPDWRVFRQGIRPLCAPRCRLDWLALTGMDSCPPERRLRFLAKIKVKLAKI